MNSERAIGIIYQWGDSARAAICELCPRDWYKISLLLRCVHAVALDGFMLKRMCFVCAHHFNLLHKVAS